MTAKTLFFFGSFFLVSVSDSIQDRPELGEAFRHCERITRQAAKNFYYGFISLPKFRRQAICAVYALSRRWDDIADDEGRTTGEKERQLNEEASKLEQMWCHLDDPVYRAVFATIQKFDIPRRYFHELLEGVRLDLVKTRYDTFSELKTYCYHVASTPGLIVLEIFGYTSDDARTYARKLGYAMQLTNILRDVKKDLSRDRIYIPRQHLREEGMSENELVQQHWSPPVERVMKRIAAQAERYFRDAKNLFPLLTPSSRTCPLILMRLYRTLLSKLKSRQFDVFSRPVKLSLLDKCYILFNTVFFHPAAL